MRIFMAILVILICSLVFGGSCIDNYEKTLVYENDLNNFTDMDDWVLEGPGKMLIADGGMMLVPDAQQAVYRKWEECGRRALKADTEYYATVKKVLEKCNPDMIEKVSDSEGRVKGGHIVCWNKAFETGSDYMVEYDFKPLSPMGLGILFFSAKGVNGEDIFSESLKKRHGVFTQYTKGDINAYHISYWADKRGTCNMRKNSGFFCLANGIDPATKDIDHEADEFKFKSYKIRLLKIGNHIRFYIDDTLSIDYTDNRFNDIVNESGLGEVIKSKVDTGKPFEGGRIGLRQMVGLIGLYDNFKVYDIKNKDE